MDAQDVSSHELIDEDSQPLLQAKASFEVAEVGPGSAADAIDSFKEEAKRILRLAGPIALQDVMILLQSAISVAFVGRLGASSLSAMTLATSVFNVTGISLIMGVASGMETLAGQVYGGNNYGAVGVILQRALLICGLTCCAILGIWTQIHHILLAMGQELFLADTAARIVHLCAPALFATATCECLKRYLMAQGVVTPTCLAYLGSTLIAPLINWVVIYVLDFRLFGAAIAYDIVSFLNLTFLFSYVLYYNTKLRGSGRETWLGWSWECFSGWGEYISIAFPSLVMGSLEMWLYESLILMTGLLPEPEINLGVMAIAFQIGTLSYMIPIGFQGAASTRVANELGKGRPDAARHSMRVALVTVACIQAVLALVSLATRHVSGFLLTSDPELVRKAAADAIWVQSLMLIPDGINAVASGVVRGCGRQLVAAILNLVTYWVIGIPLAASLAFAAHLSIKGLWLGVMVVTYIQLVAILTLILGFLDWNKEAERAASLILRASPEDALRAKTESAGLPL